MEQVLPMDQPVVKIKNAPPKKPRSEKQLEVSKKNLAIMKERREYHKKMQEEEAAAIEAKEPKVVVQESKDEVAIEHVVKKPVKKKLPPVEYITKSHLEKFKAELLADIPRPGERIVEMPVEKIVEKPIEKIVERPVDRVVEREKIVHLSGNALLDKIFFNK